ncbi:MAG: SDR family oxidoreductase, partial [Byssovorax sp.]
MAWTLQVGREPLACRLSVVASDLRSLIEPLSRWLGGEAATPGVREGRRQEGTALFQGDDEDLTALFSRWAARGKLDRIAELWVAGVAVDFRHLAREDRPHRLPLPGYPFARERYWLPELSSEPMLPVADAASCLGTLDPRGAFEGLLRFRRRWSSQEPYLDQHRIFGRPVLPGAVYLEAAFQAARQLDPKGAFHLRDMRWLAPFEVTGAARAWRVELRREAGAYACRFLDDRDTLLASCWIEPDAEAGAEPTRSNLPTDGLEHPSAAFYEGLRRAGLDHGRIFQVLSRIRVTGDGVLAELQRPALHDGVILPPELVDGALQAMAAWLAFKGAETGLRLPFAVDAVRVRRGDAIPTQVRATSSDGERFDIQLLTREGLECAVLSGVATRPAPDPLAGMLFTPGYRPTRAPAAPEPSDRPTSRRVVVLESPDAAAVCACILPWLSGDRVLRVSAPADREQWRARLGQEPVDAVYHLAGLVPEDADPDDLEVLEAVEQRALFTFLHLIQALLDGGFRTRPLQILVLVNRTRAVAAGEPLAPFAAGLYGFCRSLASEAPAWRVSCIDIVPSQLRHEASRATLAALLRACEARPRIDVVLRGDRLYEPTLEALSLEPTASPFRPGATWLILGGAGGLGFTLSRHLAATTAAKLIWIGRRAPDQEILRKQREIQVAGGQVEYVAADITEEAATRAALAPVIARLGPLHGVVHSALVLDDVPLERMDDERLRRVLAPKTRGSVILRRILRDERPEVILFFGSAVSYTGSPGQASYAAASTYEDAYAESLADRISAEVRVLHWGFWGSVGVVATEAYRQRLAQRGIGSIEAPEALAAIERALRYPVRRIMPLKADERVLSALGVSPGYALRPAREILPSLLARVLEAHPPAP